jgi:hypothetical protein
MLLEHVKSSAEIGIAIAMGAGLFALFVHAVG